MKSLRGFVIGYCIVTVWALGLIWSLPSCAAIKADARLGTSEVQGGESGETGGVVGRIGGDGDSIALWLAIAALGMSAMSYPVSRTIRKIVWTESDPSD